jgi:hypothetical protein
VHFAAADEPIAPAAAAEAQPQAMGRAEIAALVEQLDSNRYLEREQATQQILTVGETALDPLLAAANGDRPEPADRAVWVLRKLGDSEDHQLALAALDRLVRAKGRPAVVADALQIQSRLRILVCQEQLAKLGGRLSMVDFPVADVGMVRVVRVELGDDWRGTFDDLQCLVALDQHHYFRLVGSAVDNEEVKLFEGKKDLRLLQVFMSRVTPAAVDAMKKRQPQATLYVRNRALLGIGGESHPQGLGVLVTKVQEGTGAAAAEIASGDVIVEIEGKSLPDFDHLTAQIAQFEPGNEVEVTVLRGSDRSTKRVKLGDQPPEQLFLSN